MRRPLPPELVVLGDRLEGAAAHAVAARRTRRQLVLNALPSLAIAVPLAVTLGSPVPPRVAAPPAAGPDAPSFARGDDDFPPRNLRTIRPTPNDDLLLAPSELRRGLR